MTIIVMMEPGLSNEFLRLLRADNRSAGHTIVVADDWVAMFNEHYNDPRVLVVESEARRGIMPVLVHEHGRLQADAENVALTALMAVNIAESGCERTRSMSTAQAISGQSRTMQALRRSWSS